MIAGIVDYEGDILQETDKPSGILRKLLDVSRMNDRGWQAKMKLDAGLKLTYGWFLNHQENYRT